MTECDTEYLLQDTSVARALVYEKYMRELTPICRETFFFLPILSNALS